MSVSRSQQPALWQDEKRTRLKVPDKISSRREWLHPFAPAMGTLKLVWSSSRLMVIVLLVTIVILVIVTIDVVGLSEV
jgi:hypothetical protein